MPTVPAADGDEGPRLARQVTRGSFWSLVGAGIHTPIAILTTLVLARALVPAAYGRIALLGFALALAAVVAGLGLIAPYTRNLSLAYARGDVEAQRRTLQMALGTSSLQMAAAFVVAVVMIHDPIALLLVAGYCLSTAAWLPSSGYLVATNRSAINARIAIVGTIATAAAEVATAVTTHNADLVLASGLFAGSVPNLALILAAGPSMSLSGMRRPRLSRPDWTFALMGISTRQVTEIVFGQSELLFFPSSRRTDRGRFAAAATVGVRGSFLIDAVFGTIAPALTTLKGRAEDLYDRGLEILLRFSTVLFAVLFPPAIAAGSAVMPYLFPSTYGDLRAWTIPLLAIALLQTAAQPALSAWLAAGTATPAFRAAIVGAVVDVIACATLIPAYGLAGAVIASVAAGGVYICMIGWISRRQAAKAVYARFAAAICAATFGGCLIAYAGSRWIGPHSPLALVPVAAAGIWGIVVASAARPLRAGDLAVLHDDGQRWASVARQIATALFCAKAER